jgi:hypothetical protein
MGIRPRRHRHRHPVHGRRRQGAGRRHPDRRRGRKDPDDERAGIRRGARRRRGALCATRALERRPKADVPRPPRSEGSSRVVPPCDRGVSVHGDEHQDQPRRLRASLRTWAARRRRPALPHGHHGGDRAHPGYGHGPGKGPCRHPRHRLPRRGLLPHRARSVARARREARGHDRRELPALSARRRPGLLG